uniref:Serine/threonine-protein phosphatase 6 regulatory ankyrin repeat subunit B n=1 Tax=Talaromyces marneffei PM1 TaxID=1077442 RepID=A0A093V638_TALMA
MDIQQETINLNSRNVSDLLRAGADVNAAGGEYGSAIQAAGQLGRDNILDILIKNEADVNAKNVGRRNPHGRTPLSLAAGNGHSLIVRQLLARDGTNPDLPDDNGRTPLSWAAGSGESLSCIESLLQRSDVNTESADINGRTPLSWAAGNEHRGMVELLLKQPGINTNARDQNGRTPLSWAAGNGCITVAHSLVSRDDVTLDLQDSDGRTPLSWAAGAGNIAMAEILLRNPDVKPNCGDKDDRTPLSWAAEKGQRVAVEILLRRPDITLNSVDKDGRTALSWAAGEGQEEVVNLLLKRADIEPNYAERSGMPPLWWAAKKGHDGVVKLLLTAEKIDINYRDQDGGTLLSWAAETGRAKVVKLLLAQEGLSPDSQNTVGRTALSRAAETGSSAIVELLLNRPDVNPDSVDQENRTPLLWAAMKGHSAVVELLLAKEGVKLDSTDDTGRTPLLWALEMRHSHVIRSLISRDTTTLHSLVQQGNRESAKMLLSAGCNVDRCDPSGTTALRLAIQRKDREMIDMLLTFGAGTKGVMAHEWLDVYGRQKGDAVQLLEGADGQQRVNFIENSTLGSMQALQMQKRQLLVIPNDNYSPGKPLPDELRSISRNQFQISYADVNNHAARISVSLWFPFGEGSSSQQQYFNVPEWPLIRIAWTIISPSNPQSRPWQSVDHHSMLPNGWIPDDGFDFFQQFILHLEERWISVCDAADKHLKESRLDQLRSEGKNPDLMRRLARDAQKWTELRSILQDHTDVAQKFIVEYSERYHANQFPIDLQRTVNEFKVDISRRLDQLDQTIRDLLQFEFAWASINETRISTRLGHNVMLFTYVSIFYLPLAFCAAIWAIPNITDSATRNPFIITSAIVGFITLLISFNLENISTLCWRLYQGWRAKVVQDMQFVGNDYWMERGNKLESIDTPRSNFPSEWWLIWYAFWRLVRALYYRKKQKLAVRKLERRVKDQDIEVESGSMIQ